MTNEEALKQIESVCYGLELELESTIVDALKKQIPIQSEDLNIEELTVKCPVCNSHIVFALSNYCSECGQRLKYPFKKVIR